MISWITYTRREIFRKVWGHGVFESSLPVPLHRPALGAGCPGRTLLCNIFLVLGNWLGGFIIIISATDFQVVGPDNSCCDWLRRLPSVVRSPKCWTQNQAVFFQWGGTIKVLKYKKKQGTFNENDICIDSCNRDRVEDPGPGHWCRLEGTIIRSKVKIWYLTCNKLTTACSIHELNTSY